MLDLLLVEPKQGFDSNLCPRRAPAIPSTVSSDSLQVSTLLHGGGSNPIPSFICVDVVEDFIFFILIARCSH